MEHIRQGDGECVLCSVSMLTGIPLNTIRSIAKQPWEMRTKEDEIRLFARLGLHHDYYNWSSFQDIVTEQDLQGRGFLACRYEELDEIGAIWGHMVAYENGVIYDPSCLKEHIFSFWKERMEQEVIFLGFSVMRQDNRGIFGRIADKVKYVFWKLSQLVWGPNGEPYD